VGTSCTLSKDFDKFGHKNAINHENRGPPSTTLKEFETDCASMLKSINKKLIVLLGKVKLS
jgi:hypothetical protein